MASVSGVSPVSAASTATNSNTTVTQNQFLQLLVTQLQNQDPLNPTSDTEFAAQLAQFATLEQATNQTALLTSISSQLGQGATNQSVALVGQTVTASFNQLSLNGNGVPGLSFTLGGNAANVAITITDANGNVVRTVNSGALNTGVQSVAWDGKSDSGLVLPNGTYQLSLAAQNAQGAAVAVSPQVTGVVTGISINAGQPQVIIGNGGSTAPLSSITQIN